jgi:hypothetical protein
VGGWSNDCRAYKTDNTAVLEGRAVAKFWLVEKPSEQKNKAGVFR